ncbi:TPR repeat-containing protein [Pediococcus stilesii]|uniref:TPR repeat-containing protein n=2 Tax=Pediococcus stilesii TaxID=331679 RepID=A0A0R2KX90_9LACO|nr:TPR repeat-containing protein [Pediococcus stilesii]
MGKMGSEKKRDDVIHKLIQKIDENPNDAKNYYNLAAILVKQQSFDQAEELLVKSRENFNDSSSVDLLTYGLGNVYYAEGLYEKANRTFQTVRDQRLKKEANMMIAQGYFAQSEYKMAFAFGLTVLENSPSDADVNELMGDISLALGDIKMAQKYYDVALKAKKTAKLLFNRGVVEMAISKTKNNKFFDLSKEIDAKLFEQNKQRLVDVDKLLNKNVEEDD